MEKYVQPTDLKVFGVQVKTFPSGIKEAFTDLMKKLGVNRAYYGVSWCDKNGSIKYYAMAAENFEGEAKGHEFETLIIPKGEYFTEKIVDWMSKTDCIKDVFHNLMGDSIPDEKHPCIEWYKSEKEMLCMVKAF